MALLRASANVRVRVSHIAKLLLRVFRITYVALKVRVLIGQNSAHSGMQRP